MTDKGHPRDIVASLRMSTKSGPNRGKGHPPSSGEIERASPNQLNRWSNGPSAGGRLAATAEQLGGETLTSLPKPPELGWEALSTQTLGAAAASGGPVLFDLTHLQDPGELRADVAAAHGRQEGRPSGAWPRARRATLA